MSIGVGIVGLGARGLRSVGRAICQVGRQTGVHISAVCDSHPQRLADGTAQLRAMARAGGIPDAFSAHLSDESLIACPDVDVVMITSPQYVHQGPFERAAEAGKVVYCEKPLSASRASCEAMRATWKQSRPRCMVGLTRRYENVWVRAQSLVAAGAVGKPQLVLLRSVIPYYRYFGGWWRDSRLSGDLLNEKSSHHFDVLNWFTGSLPSSVYAIGGRNVFLPRPGYPAHCSECLRRCAYRRPKQQREEYSDMFRARYDDDPDGLLSRDLCVYSDQANIIDHAIVSLDYRNGIKASLFFSVFGQDVPDQETLEVVGDTGRLILTRHDASIDVVDHDGEQRVRYDCSGTFATESHFGADRNMVHELANFARGAEPVAGFEDAYRASLIAFSAQDSLHDGHPRVLTDLS